MKTIWFKAWDYLRSSLWFVPTLMALFAVTAAFGTVALDQQMAQQGSDPPGWLYSGGAEGASVMLSTLAGSMITIAGTVFSLTLVALSLASTQLGPRLLRNFMRDTVNQVVLGTFLSTFLYCLLVLRTIRRTGLGDFVPHLSVSVAILMAIASLGVLIYFIHHVSISIQTEEVVAHVGRDLIEGIKKQFPAQPTEPVPSDANASAQPDWPEAFAQEARAVGATMDGYLQLIDFEALVAVGERKDLRMRLECRPGAYLSRDQALLAVWPGQRVDAALATELSSAFVLGHQRTATQDVEFPINQLVEIAVRALSPGVNDPFTAIACIDRLGSGLRRLAQRSAPKPAWRDARETLRLVATVPTFASLLDLCFNQIRQNARENPAVLGRLLDTIGEVAGVVHRAGDRAALLRHARMLARAARARVPEAADRLAVERHYAAASRRLASTGQNGLQSSGRILP